MSTKITRRDVLRLAGGSALGMLFTPVPWKLLDDSSIWTQNWSLMPAVPRGPISSVYSACTLCPAGCAVKARLVGGVPVSLHGVPEDSITHGVLCPSGLAGHHMPFHPLRLLSPHKFNNRTDDAELKRVSFDEVLVEIFHTISGQTGAVAVLDQQPGRVISSLYQEFVSKVPRGAYLIPPSREDATLTAIQSMFESSVGTLAYDFENAKTILSFGAALIDGWGTPGRMMAVLNKRNLTGLQIIQVETNQSRTALQADRWLPIRPGTEAVFAFGLANVIMREHLYPPGLENTALDFATYERCVATFDPDVVAERTAISSDAIVQIARDLVRKGPSISIAGCDPGGGPLEHDAQMAISGLNLLLGNVGRSGGILTRNDMRRTPSNNATEIRDTPDHSIGLLIVDGADSGYALPWTLIERKLVPERSMVVSLSPFVAGLALHADYIIPSAAHYESLMDVPAQSDSPTARFALSIPLFSKKEDLVKPFEFIKRISEMNGVGVTLSSSWEDQLKSHSKFIYERHRGTVFTPADGSSVTVASISTEDDFWMKLKEGGIWSDEPAKPKALPRFSLLGNGNVVNRVLSIRPDQDDRLLMMPHGWKSSVTTANISPIMSKVFQESELRSLGTCAAINPRTALKHGLVENEPATIRSENGNVDVLLHFDESIMPNVIELTVGPSRNNEESIDHPANGGVLSLCMIKADGTWRITDVTVEKAS